jgi:transketolase
VMRYAPRNPRSEGRDRFVLSKGHGPVSYFAILADKGFFPAEELRKFETWEGILGGHPDRNLVPGVEASTGSLGHGLPMAIGVALGLRAKGSERRVFALIGDGECNEGSIWEAILLAGNLGLANLTCILIDNHSSSQNLGDMVAKFTSFGWEACAINGRDHEQIYNALIHTHPERPIAIVADIEKES